MSFFVIPITALIASILTFFSGFGLGTILLPVFAIYYDLSTAVILTAVVHFANNLFKIGLIFKNVNWNVVLKFGTPSVIMAFVGAKLLISASYSKSIITSFQINGHTFSITTIGALMGSLIILFSALDLIPYFKNKGFKEDKLIVGGLLSGFFGGLSGHQGTIRSAFLIRLNLPKESFIATGTAIACTVDTVRIIVYSLSMNFLQLDYNKGIIGIAIGASVIGVLVGNQLLKKTTIEFIKWFVAAFMFAIGLLMILGIIT